MANITAATAQTNEVAQTALRQLARGQRTQILAALLGIKEFSIAQLDNGDVRVSFQFKGSRKSNCLWLTYNAGPDTYTLELVRLSPTKGFLPVYKAEGVCADQLAEIFECETGLYVTF